jgi:hypothetical protein
MLQGAGNLLLTRDCLESISSPWFDHDFALTGGEDYDFFVRLAKAGKRFAWADEAIAYGDVPDERLSVKWVLRRAYSVGNSDMRVAMKHAASRIGLAHECAKIGGALLAAPLISLVLVADPARRLKGPRLFFRAAGKVAAILGRHHHAYAVTHGG